MLRDGGRGLPACHLGEMLHHVRESSQRFRPTWQAARCSAAVFVPAVRAQTRSLTASRVTESCQCLVITCPFSVLSGFQESIVGNCMDRSSPGQAMQVPDHNGLGYPARPAAGEHPRPRTLQRHHTIQNSDDAYVSRKRPVPSRCRDSAESPRCVCIMDEGSRRKDGTLLRRAAKNELLLRRPSQHISLLIPKTF